MAARKGSVDEFVAAVVGDFARLHTATVVTLGAGTVVCLYLGVTLLWLVPLYMVRWVVGAAVWCYTWRRRLARASLPYPGVVSALRSRRLYLRRRSYVTKQWQAACQVNGIVGRMKQTPKLHKVRPTIEGDLTALVSPGPLSVKGGVDRIVQCAPDIAETCSCVELVVRPTGVGHAMLSFLWTEVMERVVPVAELPKAPGNRIAYGVQRDGSAASVEMGLSSLTGGMTGSGKSGLSWSLLADLNRQGIRYDLYASDPKGGIELGVLADKVGERMNGTLRVADYAPSAADTARLIEACAAALTERQERQQGRKWTPADHDDAPLIVLLVDELIDVMHELRSAGPPNNRDVHIKRLMRIISQGRASGVMLVGLSQLGQKTIIGDVRDMIPQRICLATRNAINTAMILGDGAEDAGALCSRIVNRPGMGYAYDERRRGFELVRATWCDDDDVERIAEGLVPEGMQVRGSKGAIPKHWAVYRMFNAAGECLYVGETGRAVDERWAEHAAEKPWWGEVAWSGDHAPLVTWTHGPNCEAAALAVEEREVKRLLPRYNDRHNRANPLRRDWRAEARDRRRPPAVVPDLFSEPDPEPAEQNVTPIKAHGVRTRRPVNSRRRVS